MRDFWKAGWEVEQNGKLNNSEELVCIKEGARAEGNFVEGCVTVYVQWVLTK